MATIILKGTDKKLETTIFKAKEINRLKQDGENPKTLLDINGVVLELGDIKYAMYDEDKDKELNKEASSAQSDKEYEIENTFYFQEIKSIMSGTDSEKIKYNLAYASFICQAITGVWLKEWASTNVEGFKKLQEILKQDIKTHFVVNPKSYKEVFSFTDPNTGANKNIESIARSGAFRLVEKQLSEAIHTSKLILKLNEHKTI